MGNACCDERHIHEPNSSVDIPQPYRTSSKPLDDQQRVRRYSSLRTQVAALPITNHCAEQIIKKMSKFMTEPKKIWKMKHPYNLVYANQEDQFQNQLPKGYIKLYKIKQNGDFGGYYEGKITDSFEPDLNDGFFVYHNGSHLQGTGPYEGIYKHQATNLHYEGGWVNERPHGRGIEQNNKGRYEGDYFEGEKHGQGKFQWTDGATYQGGFEKDCFHGKGTYRNPSLGYRYEGDHCQDNKHGRGVEESPREHYQGQFYKGKRCGRGVLKVYEDDSKSRLKYTYEGVFQDGKPHGQGVFIEEGGRRINGIWNQGALLSIH